VASSLCVNILSRVFGYKKEKVTGTVYWECGIVNRIDFVHFARYYYEERT
jgi:hypothetical protein